MTAAFQGQLDIRAGGLPGRPESKKNRRQGGRQNSETENVPIETEYRENDFRLDGSSKPIRSRPQKARSSPAEPPMRCDDDALDEQLPNNLGTLRANGGAYRKFA